MLSAIVIVGPESRASGKRGETTAKNLSVAHLGQPGTPLVCVEVLGRSVIERLIDELRRGGVEKISVYQGISESASCADIHSTSPIEFCSAETAWAGATQRLASCKDAGAEAIVVTRVAEYMDLDLKDALRFHREQGQVVTRAFDDEEPLDLWIVDPARIDEGADILSARSNIEPARYLVPGYVNRLQDPGDLRRLVVDGLTARCGLRPKGLERVLACGCAKRPRCIEMPVSWLRHSSDVEQGLPSNASSLGAAALRATATSIMGPWWRTAQFYRIVTSALGSTWPTRLWMATTC